MGWPEPSSYECGAPWNVVTRIDEDGEEYDACGCCGCEKKIRDEAWVDWE